MAKENNNLSIENCKMAASVKGWEKEPKRNVLIDGKKKWAFSYFKNPEKLECRQFYEECHGIIGMDHKGCLVKYNKPDASKYAVTLISPSRLKAYSISVPREDCEEISFRK